MPKRSIRQTKERLKRRGRSSFTADWIFETPSRPLTADERVILGHLRDKILPLANRGPMLARQLRRLGKTSGEIARQLRVPERRVRYWLQRKPRPIRKRDLESVNGYAYVRRQEGGAVPVVLLQMVGSCGYNEFGFAKSEVDHVGMVGIGYCRQCKRPHDFAVIAQQPAPYELAYEWREANPRSRVAVGMKERLSGLFQSVKKMPKEIIYTDKAPRPLAGSSQGVKAGGPKRAGPRQSAKT